MNIKNTILFFVFTMVVHFIIKKVILLQIKNQSLEKFLSVDKTHRPLKMSKNMMDTEKGETSEPELDMLFDDEDLDFDLDDLEKEIEKTTGENMNGELLNTIEENNFLSLEDAFETTF